MAVGAFSYPGDCIPEHGEALLALSAEVVSARWQVSDCQAWPCRSEPAALTGIPGGAGDVFDCG
jgi:hypothetical protein